MKSKLNFKRVVTKVTSSLKNINYEYMSNLTFGMVGTFLIGYSLTSLMLILFAGDKNLGYKVDASANNKIEYYQKTIDSLKNRITLVEVKVDSMKVVVDTLQIQVVEYKTKLVAAKQPKFDSRFYFFVDGGGFDVEKLNNLINKGTPTFYAAQNQKFENITVNFHLIGKIN